MKRFTKIYIALLAACVVGGSAFTLTGCGTAEDLMNDAGDMVSEMVSDVASGFNDMASAVLPETSSTAPSESSALASEPMDSFSAGRSMVSGDFHGGYLSGYSDTPFVESFEQKMLSFLGDAENITVEWQEGWNGNGDHAPDESDAARLQDGQMPFTGCVMFDDQNGKENEYYLYMIYDPNENTVSAVRVHDGRNGMDQIMDEEEAVRAVEEIMAGE